MFAVSNAKLGIESRARSSSITRVSLASRQMRTSLAVRETVPPGADFGACAAVQNASAKIPSIEMPMRLLADDAICHLQSGSCVVRNIVLRAGLSDGDYSFPRPRTNCFT